VPGTFLFFKSDVFLTLFIASELNLKRKVKTI
jgi:hypothetical protein